MTIQNTTIRKAGPSQGNGSNHVFPFTFKVFTTAEILVTFLGTDGYETIYVLTTDYTVSLNADQEASPGGSVTTVLAPATLTYITITSVVTYTQNLALTSAGGFFPSSINDALDRVVIQVQQLDEQVYRSAKLPVSGIGSLNPSSLVFGVNAQGVPILAVLADIVGSTVSAFMATLLGSVNAAAARATLVVLGLSGGTMTGALNEAPTGTKASAGTCDLSTVDANTVIITGTTTITSFGTLAAGVIRNLRFSGAGLTLTYNATSLILPTSANIQTAIDDEAVFVSLGSGNWKCTSYDRKTGFPLKEIPGQYADIRQTVQSGPVDTNGYSAFGGSTGSTTVTVSGTLIVTAAQGFDVNGQVNRNGSITNPSWTGLSTNGAMYLFLDVAADGTCTTASSTLVPAYIAGGTPSVTNAQFTFDFTKWTGYLGNGSTAPATYRVCVGEVTVAGSVVTAIVWYALNGRYESPDNVAWPAAGVLVSLNHNIGSMPINRTNVLCIVKNTVAGYTAGDILTNVGTNTVGQLLHEVVNKRTLTTFRNGSSGFPIIIHGTTGTDLNGVIADYYYKLVLGRDW